MRRIVTSGALAALATLLLLARGAADEDADRQAGQDRSRRFEAATVLGKVHEINLLEIRAGELALSRGVAPQVKEYARQLVDDHKKADEKVLDAANRLGLALRPTVPETPEEIVQKESLDAALEDLSRVEGGGFDRQFLQLTVDGHDEAIEFVRMASENAEDEEVKGLLAELLPTLERHREHADDLLRSLSAPTP